MRSLRTLSQLTLGLLTTTGLLLSTSGTGSAAETGALSWSGPANVRGMGQCWDLGSTKAGAEVVMTPCHYEDTYESQKWYRTTNSNAVFNIQDDYGLCLDLRSNDEGAHVITAPCHYEDTYISQKWYPSGGNPYNFRNGNGLCMDRPTANGGPVVMSVCKYQDSYLSQKWAVVGYWAE